MGAVMERRLWVMMCMLTITVAMLSWTTILLLPHHYLLAAATSVGCLLSMACCAVCMDILLLHPADSHTCSSLLAQYYYLRVTSFWQGRKAHQIWEYTTQNCNSIQNDLLLGILHRNRDTLYGREYRLGEIKSREEFRDKHPLTDYDHYEPYSDRIAKGEQNVLTADKVIYLALSSGTTGKAKRYPLTDFILKIAVYTKHLSLYNIRPLLLQAGLQKNLVFRLITARGTTECGLPTGGAAQIFLRTAASDANVSPPGYLRIHNEAAAFYVQAFFSLAEPEIGRIDGFYSDLVYSFFNFIMKYASQLCDDIEKGSIRPFPNLPEEIRTELNSNVKPDPRRAAEVRRLLVVAPSGTLGGAEMESDSKAPSRASRKNQIVKNMARRLWPRMQHVGIGTAGGLAFSYNHLMQGYLKGLTAGYPLHVSTESIIGAMSMDDAVESGTYVFIPDSAFFEFIPIEDQHEQDPKTLFIDQVEVDRQYEVVVTTHYGLCRNRFGDVVEIVGSHNNTPKYRFMYRAGQILTIAYDRTSETVMYEAVQRFAARWQGLTVTNYTATESFHLESLTDEVYYPGRYVIFMEVTDGEEDVRLTQQQCDLFDDILREVHWAYEMFRGKESVGPAQVIQCLAKDLAPAIKIHGK